MPYFKIYYGLILYCMLGATIGALIIYLILLHLGNKDQHKNYFFPKSTLSQAQAKVWFLLLFVLILVRLL